MILSIIHGLGESLFLSSDSSAFFILPHLIGHCNTFCEEFEKALEEMREFQKKGGKGDEGGEGKGMAALFAGMGLGGAGT